MVNLTWRVNKYNVHKLHQRYTLWYINTVHVQIHQLTRAELPMVTLTWHVSKYNHSSPSLSWIELLHHPHLDSSQVHLNPGR